MHKFSRRSFIAAALGAVFAFAQPTYAKNDEPITIVVPYAAGGTNDNFARILAEGMSKELNRHVIVENRPGANGIIGTSHVARKGADGTTLLLGGTGPVSLNIMLRPSLNYKFDDFEPVAMLFDGPLTITVPSANGFNSVKELMESGKKKNKPLLYGTLGPGSVTHLYGLLLSKTFDTQLTAVAYKSNNAALIDLMAGRGDMNFATPIPMIKDSKDLKILALTTDKRDPNLPDIPSIAELGHPELVTTYWTGLLAAKGTPKELVDQFAAAAIKTVQTEAYKQVIKDNGQIEKAGGPEMMKAQLEQDREHWGKIIRDNNIVID